jgi:phasin family protein
MANPRQAERDMSQAGQEAVRKTAEEAGRAAHRAADAGAEVLGAGADMMKRNAEALQQAWESGSKAASQWTEQSFGGFARAFGLSGENAQQAAEQSRRNMESIMQSGTILANGMQSVSRELFELARKRLEQNLQRTDALMHSRTPQDVMAAQSELFRENMEDLIETTRRIADISKEVAENAGRKMSELASR